MEHRNLLGGPPVTLLPEDPAAADLADGADPAAVAAAHPACLAAWAALASLAMDRGEPVASYAYARTGYHRGLDQLRRAGWRRLYALLAPASCGCGPSARLQARSSQMLDSQDRHATSLRHANHHETDVIMTQSRGEWRDRGKAGVGCPNRWRSWTAWTQAWCRIRPG